MEPDETLSVDTLWLTPAGFTVTEAVWLIGVPPAVAEIVFASALVELNVAVKTPLPFVVPEADGVKLLAVPVDDTVTDEALIALPNPSFTVTVMVEAAVGDVHPVLHAVSDAVLAVTVDVPALTGPGVPVALNVA